MGAWIINLFTGPLASLAIKAVLAVIAAVVLAILWQQHDNQVALRATLEAQKAQLEQVVKDQQTVIGKLDQFNEIGDKIYEQTKAANDKIESQVDQTNSWIAKQPDRPASDLLKKTIESLKNGAWQ